MDMGMYETKKKDVVKKVEKKVVVETPKKPEFDFKFD